MDTPPESLSMNDDVQEKCSVDIPSPHSEEVKSLDVRCHFASTQLENYGEFLVRNGRDIFSESSCVSRQIVPRDVDGMRVSHDDSNSSESNKDYESESDSQNSTHGPRFRNYFKRTPPKKKPTVASLHDELKETKRGIKQCFQALEDWNVRKEEKEQEERLGKAKEKNRREEERRTQNEKQLNQILFALTQTSEKMDKTEKNLTNKFSEFTEATEQRMARFLDEFTGVKDRVTVVEDNQTVMNKEFQVLKHDQTRNKDVMEKVNEKTNEAIYRAKQTDLEIKGLTQNMSRLDVRVDNIEKQMKSQKVVLPRADSEGTTFSLNDVLAVEGTRNFYNIPKIGAKISHSRVNRHSLNESSDDSDHELSMIKKESQPKIANENFILKIIDHMQHGSGKFPSYSGDVDIEIYKRQVDTIAKQKDWSDEKLATQIIAHLEGDARKLLCLIPKGQETDLKTIWLTLSCNSPKTEVSEQAKNLLLNYRQQKGQSLLNLSLDIKRLVMEAYPNTDQAMRDELAVDSFIKAIQNHIIKFQLKICPVKTIEEARVIAERIQMASMGDKSLYQYQVNHVYAKSKINSEYETDDESHVPRKRKLDDCPNVNDVRSMKNKPPKSTNQNGNAKNQLEIQNRNSNAQNFSFSPQNQTNNSTWRNPRQVNFSFPPHQNFNNSQNHYNRYLNPSFSRRNTWRYQNSRGRRYYFPYGVRNDNSHFSQNQNSNFYRNSQDVRQRQNSGNAYDSRMNVNQSSYDYNASAVPLNEQRQQKH
jgi:hypothetical protein